MLIVAFPRTPLRGTRTCWILQHFRRAKSEWLPAFYSGPLGPDCSRIAAVAVPLSRLAWSSQRFRSVSRRRGGYQPPESLLPSRKKVPSACEADEGRLLRCCTSPAGGPRASPTHSFLNFVGEGLKANRPKAERSHPEVCPSRPWRLPSFSGPASVRPLQNAGMVSKYPVGAAHWAARSAGTSEAYPCSRSKPLMLRRFRICFGASKSQLLLPQMNMPSPVHPGFQKTH